jgi:hypothetical protein
LILLACFAFRYKRGWRLAFLRTAAGWWPFRLLLLALRLVVGPSATLRASVGRWTLSVAEGWVLLKRI